MIQAFEGIRGFAALLVALYHLDIGREYFSVLRHAYVFVDLFFVLSGYVICAAYVRKLDAPSDLLPFLIRRVGRLFPLLVFSTAAFIFAANALIVIKRLAISHGFGASLGNPGSTDFLVPSGLELATTLTFTHSLGIFDKLILNTPTWSISTEFYTYLLFAIVCLCFRGKGRLAVFAMLVAGAFVVTTWASVSLYNCLEVGACNTQTFDFGFARCVLSFFLGALTFHFRSSVRIDPKKLQLPAMGLLTLYFWQVDAIPALSLMPPYLFAILILSLSQDDGVLAFPFKLNLSQILGQRSYSIYLMHMPFALFFQWAGKRADGMVASGAVVISYVITLYVVSGWTFKYVESPFRANFNWLSANLDKTRGQESRGAEVVLAQGYHSNSMQAANLDKGHQSITEEVQAD